MKLRICAFALSLLMVFSPNECTADEIIHKSDEVEAIIIDEDGEIEEVVPEIVSLGVCKLTAYCKENYPHVCNNGSSNSTATGTVPTVGRTIAVDPSVIPYGTQVIINGHTYIAEDCGGAVKRNKIDILFETHKEALQFGVQYAEVFKVIS